MMQNSQMAGQMSRQSHHGHNQFLIVVI